MRVRVCVCVCVCLPVCLPVWVSAPYQHRAPHVALPVTLPHLIFPHVTWQALISRSQQAHNVEYIKNITVKYLETKDPTLLRALSIALQISPDELARVEKGQAKVSSAKVIEGHF